LISVIVVSLCVAGCGKGGAVTPAGSGSVGAATQTPPTDPAARVAFDFLMAVRKADEAQITACLTPQAAQQLKQRDQRFPVSGMDTVSLQFGEVRKPSENQALVQCMLTEVAKEGEVGKSEEICCLLRLVDNQWRVSGLAIGTAQGRPQILNFEAPPLEAMGPPATPQTAEAAGTSTVGRPSPPRTANENFSPGTVR
jgi:hypothetical protein